VAVVALTGIHEQPYRLQGFKEMRICRGDRPGGGGEDAFTPGY
jgi:hypothetical protein